MSFPYQPNLHAAKIESLETQHEFLNLLRLRHLNWMNSADEPRIKDYHFQIAELVEKIDDYYSLLLDELRLPTPTPSVEVPPLARAIHTDGSLDGETGEENSPATET